MIVSESKKFIFIHIWKTAGTSLTQDLIKYGVFSQRLADEFIISRKIINGINRVFSLEDLGNKWFTGVHKHATAMEAKKYVGSEKWGEYYSFAFVRNPYDWLVSWYFYIKQSNGRHIECAEANKDSFKAFVLNKIKVNCQTQWSFVSQDDELILDFIGKLEDLQTDFDKICTKLDLPKAIVGHANSSKRKRFLDYYDEELIEAVDAYFENDFIKLGYEMLSKKGGMSDE